MTRIAKRREIGFTSILVHPTGKFIHPLADRLESPFLARLPIADEAPAVGAHRPQTSLRLQDWSYSNASSASSLTQAFLRAPQFGKPCETSLIHLDPGIPDVRPGVAVFQLSTFNFRLCPQLHPIELPQFMHL